METRIKVLLLATALMFSAACDFDGWGDSSRYKEEFHFTHDLAPGGRVSIENFNGSIEITAWDRGQVQIDGEKYAATEELLGQIKVQVTPSPDFIQVRTLREAGRGNMGARYRIKVPANTLLDDIRSSNGPVRIEGVEKVGRIKTSNGPVRIVRASGNATIQTSNGPVEINEFQGSVNVHTSNGPVRVDVSRLATAARLRTSNGPITLTTGGPLSNDVIATTSNGPITLKLAESTAARIKARTSNARISSDLKFATVERQTKTSLDAAIGTGGPLLDLTTSNGGIRIERN